MFDVGIWEIGVIGVVALVVLGPERLPKVARTAGHMFGRLQRYVANVKADINREMEFSDLAKMKDEVTSAAKSFEQTMNDHANAVEGEVRAVEKSTAATETGSAPVSPQVLPAPTQTELIAEQDAGLAPASAIGQAPSVRPPEQSVAAPPNNTQVKSAPQSFDLGIEPLRRRVSQH